MQIPRDGFEPVWVPCRGCGTDVLTSRVINKIADDGTATPIVAIDLCLDCKSEVKRQAAERKIMDAERRAQHAKTLADLLNRVPNRQSRMDLGFD